MPIKNFLITVKNHLLSLISICSSGMSLNCQVHPCMTLNYKPPCSVCISLNCQDMSSCMTLNCPPYCLMTQYHSSCDRPCDSLTTWTNDITYSAFTRICPDLDLSSFTDSLQTHDSLVTPESPQYSPSPHDSLNEGIMQVSANHEPVTWIGTTQDGLTQVGTEGHDLLAYDSLIITLSWLSLRP